MYYGKYATNYMSDDHGGLDNEVRYKLTEALAKYGKKTGREHVVNLFIGILSFSESRFVPTYSSDEEIDAFDFYYRYETNKSETYVNGEVV